jgi:hypothetical protein
VKHLDPPTIGVKALQVRHAWGASWYTRHGLRAC